MQILVFNNVVRLRHICHNGFAKCARWTQTQSRELFFEKMFKNTVIGGRHTAVENLRKGFPKHMRGEVEDGIRKLIRTGFILSKPTGYGLQVSLNPRMIEEIKKIIGV